MATNNQDAFPEDGETGTDPVASMSASSVGATLRDAREKMGLDLAAVADRLRIRQPFLRALEEGRHQDLPGGTYAIGFLRSYAEFLGLDDEEMVRRFKREASDALTGRAELVFPSPVSEGRVPTGAILFVGLIVAAAAYGGWYWLSGRSHSVANLVSPLPGRLSSLLDRPADLTTAKPGSAPHMVKVPAPASPAKAPPAKTMVVAKPAPSVPTQPAIVAPKNPAVTKAAKPATAKPAATAPVAAPTPAVSTTTKAAAPKPAATATVSKTATGTTPAIAGTTTPAKPVSAAAAAAAAAGPSGVVLTAATGDCWIQVQSKDGQLVLSRLLHKGETYDVPKLPGLSLTVGNAGALQIAVDGKILPSLGGSGQVLHNINLDPKALLSHG